MDLILAQFLKMANMKSDLFSAVKKKSITFFIFSKKDCNLKELLNNLLKTFTVLAKFSCTFDTYSTNKRRKRRTFCGI